MEARASSRAARSSRGTRASMAARSTRAAGLGSNTCSDTSARAGKRAQVRARPFCTRCYWSGGGSSPPSGRGKREKFRLLKRSRHRPLQEQRAMKARASSVSESTTPCQVTPTRPSVTFLIVNKLLSLSLSLSLSLREGAQTAIGASQSPSRSLETPRRARWDVGRERERAHVFVSV